ncbi:DNA cross-link repair protein [Lachnellula occidentalis]|uniref:DNA cross-link repair protein n=1 Tax=Lachnellula occidentalis TaxID=215460 RepID=A0A8H8S823_9HELO|nr:DNA cross-link repair protein [Lachnellula occidentalis]
MFRNPRANSNTGTSIEAPLKPSTGRPPTPPNGISTPHPPSAMASRGSAKPLTPRPNSKSNLPMPSRPSTKKAAPARTPGKGNNSILNFFKKVDSPMKDDSIFMSQGSQANPLPAQPALGADILDETLDDIYGDTENERFNEKAGPVKKRKTSNTSTLSGADKNGEEDVSMGIDGTGLPGELPAKDACTPPPPQPTTKSRSKKPRRKGPFLSDSESDYEVDTKTNKANQAAAVGAEKRELRTRVSKQDSSEIVETKPIEQEDIVANQPVVPEVESVKPPYRRRTKVPVAKAQAKWEALQPMSSRSSSRSSLDRVPTGKTSSPVELPKEESPGVPDIPTLKKEATSIDEWSKFDDFEEFPDDEFADGEEFVERKWMEEQARLEAAEAGHEEFDGFGDDHLDGMTPDEEITACCPICSASLGGITPDEATRHVNGCLDGNPIPLPKLVKTESSEVKMMPQGASNRFARKAAVPRPGQTNPFEADTKDVATSAFSKIMSGHAEDAAWATAAAAENASRGKAAYHRTCPFYKIMPGFFICVDAFRYGAVQGCNAYFLSHFHSDHYIGLTASWCHGPIFCSKVTGNLVKQQLRVNPKWVVSLDFEERTEVPGTQGVAVTMIPANHCPGSSLFLFEKVIGKGNTPKTHRVLHCGDFRACPAHLTHPLLMPNIVDSLTNKTKQQRIDVCYLDTTYLNPRYAFPSQEEVITACADMCVSLRKERAEDGDAWETAKRERAGSSMAKFIASAPAPKAEDDSIAMSLTSDKARGRLLVVCGTYSIGKERICMGIARALDCKIWAPPGKMRICAALEDPELMSRMTDDPKEAQIHMQMLMELRPETLHEYLTGYKPHFSRVVGFRPSGWNYKPPTSRLTTSPTLQNILYSPSWSSHFSLHDLTPQRGSTREASCFGVPYSEHSSFRELTMFVCALRIEKIVPTVNVGSAASRSKMKVWIERWLAERRKNGTIALGSGEGQVRW